MSQLVVGQKRKVTGGDGSCFIYKVLKLTENGRVFVEIIDSSYEDSIGKVHQWLLEHTINDEVVGYSDN